MAMGYYNRYGRTIIITQITTEHIVENARNVPTGPPTPDYERCTESELGSKAYPLLTNCQYPKRYLSHDSATLSEKRIRMRRTSSNCSSNRYKCKMPWFECPLQPYTVAILLGARRDSCSCGMCMVAFLYVGSIL